MASRFRALKGKINRLHDRTKTRAFGAHKTKTFNGKSLLQYKGDPDGYAKHVLGVTLTPDQRKIVELVENNHRVFCRAGHTVGKSFISAFMVSYLYDVHDKVIIITTAPRMESVKDIIWREIRSLRNRAGLGGFTGPRSLRLQDGPDHLAFGTTAKSHTGFQGKHGVRVFIIVDEAVGLEPEFWPAIDSMLQGEQCALLAIYNPTTTACQVFQEEKNKHVKVHVISCLVHPNIIEQLKGNPKPYPAAVSLEWVLEHIEKYADELYSSDVPDPTKGDFLFPPAWAANLGYCVKNKIKPKWWRSTPKCDGRIRGEWPLSSVDTFWSRFLIERCRTVRLEIQTKWPCVIGVDVARYGDDMTEMIVRRGPCVVHHESHSGWDGVKIGARLKELCHQWHAPNQHPRKVRVFVDETGGWGTTVIDQCGTGESKYTFIGVNAAGAARDKKEHKNARAELWATTVLLAKSGLVDFSRLSKDSFEQLESELSFQKYELLPGDVIKAVDKDEVKKELGRSPDVSDALNLCFFQGYSEGDEARKQEDRNKRSY